jgi:hypothetical protein
MEANRDAPVLASENLAIEAPPKVVWDVMVDINDWPSWNDDVKEASLEGQLSPGAVFRWKAGPGTITSTVEEVDPLHEIAWTGRSLGIEAVHVWRLQDQGDATLVTTDESWDGMVARVLRKWSQRTVEQGLTRGLQSLKREAERRWEQGEPATGTDE